MKSKPILTLSLISFFFFSADAQQTIGIIDVFGNRSTSTSAVYQALLFKVGDTLYRNKFNKEQQIQKLKKDLHVPDASLEAVCCTDGNKEIIYIGINESGSKKSSYRKAPTRSIALPREMKVDYDSLMLAIREAVLKGQNSEDFSQGHSLVAYPKARTLQERFVTYASQSSLLKEVIYSAVNALERAAAVQILAYAKDKNAIIEDLVYAVSDPNEEVRNNAIRALSVIAAYAEEHPEQNITIPAQPFINMLNSLVWTDRNKASLLLFQLTNEGDPEILKALHQQALTSLLEMAQWKDKGHAMPSFIILGRIAGLEDEKLFEAFHSNSFSDSLQEIIKKVQSH